MATSFDQVVLGSPAPEFSLRGTDGRGYSLEDVAGERGTVIVFICNHCPYVKTVIGRLVRDAHALRDERVGVAAICSNDAVAYPEDSFENMQAFARAHALPFPYLHDDDQAVAHAYGAVCTPDFFGYDAERRLKYHGRLDEGRTRPPPASSWRRCVPMRRQVSARADQRPSPAARSSGSRDSDVDQRGTARPFSDRGSCSSWRFSVIL